MNAIDRVNERQRKRDETELMYEDYRLSVLEYALWMDDFRKRTGLHHPFLHEAEMA